MLRNARRAAGEATLMVAWTAGAGALLYGWLAGMGWIYRNLGTPAFLLAALAHVWAAAFLTGVGDD